MKFSFPDNCCICMAKPETTVKLNKTKSFTPHTITYRVDVPICGKCKNIYFTKIDDKKFKYSFISGFAGLIIGGIIGGLFERTEIFLAIFLGAVIGCVICAVVASEIVKATHGHPPVEIDDSFSQWQGEAFWIKFDNQEYNALFREMNVDIYYSFLAGK